MRQFILEEVKEALDSWRTTKKSKCQPIPDEIWQKIKSLKNNYTKKQIISTLRINYSQYKMKIEDSTGVNKKVKVHHHRHAKVHH